MNSLWTTILSALRNTSMHPLRSGLTSLGIVAGVAAVVVVSSVAEGTKKEIQESIEALGANRVDVNSGTRSGAQNAKLAFGGLYMLDDRDVTEIRRGVRGVEAASGFLRGTADITFGRSKSTALWIGGDSDAARVLGYELSTGRNLSVREGLGAKRVIVLGDGVAAKLFGASRRIGARIRMGNTSFVVIGILKRRGLSISGEDLDDAVIVPIEAARRQLMGDFPLPHNALQQIGVRLSDMSKREVAESSIERLLRAKRKLSTGEISDFYIASVKETVEAKSKVDRSMSFLLLSVAAICLVVGGVGVMNIMLVSIAERVGEIGLRMALGASPGRIKRQFLAESILLSTVGGAIGGVLGVAGAYVVSSQQGVTTQINVVVLVTAVVVTILTGVLFGLWPAHQAARLSPVDALRRL